MKLSKKKLLNSTQLSPSHKAYLLNYLDRMRNVRIYQFLIIISFIALWEITTRLKIVDSFIFSSPSRVIKCFIDMVADGSIFYHIGVTLLETFVSFSLVIIIGILAAVILWWNESAAKVLEPYLVVLNSLPKSALAPVFIVWLGNNMKTIIVAAVSVGTVS
ncbi:ABC transporter permease [Anaerocolumna sp. AGMB13025]|uniref:ABC transporter permease n=1 Tax=Anaerocolumna sp. AGMB13025 TaxID=3039116 RepID=UPI002F40465C